MTLRNVVLVVITAAGIIGGFVYVYARIVHIESQQVALAKRLDELVTTATIQVDTDGRYAVLNDRVQALEELLTPSPETPGPEQTKEPNPNAQVVTAEPEESPAPVGEGQPVPGAGCRKQHPTEENFGARSNWGRTNPGF